MLTHDDCWPASSSKWRPRSGRASCKYFLHEREGTLPDATQSAGRPHVRVIKDGAMQPWQELVGSSELMRRLMTASSLGSCHNVYLPDCARPSSPVERGCICFLAPTDTLGERRRDTGTCRRHAQVEAFTVCEEGAVPLSKERCERDGEV